MTAGRSGTFRTGGQILVDQLLIHGSTLGFCVPGESYLAVLDALHDARDRFRLINARHEAGAAHMAEAHGKLTGRPGICFVTRGPGATHAAVGVHTAMQDSTPMILLVGQVATSALHREAFQEIDYRAMFGGVAKWVGQIERAARIPEYVSRAYHAATSGRPGPVVLSLPEDVLSDVADVTDALPFRPAIAEVAPAALEQLRPLLDAAERPLFLVGGSGWTDEASAAFTSFAERIGAPVACSFRRQDVVDNGSDIFCGDLGTSDPATLPGRLREADLVVVVGSRLSELTTQAHSIMDVPRPAQRLVHIHADPDEIGKVYAPELSLVGSVASFASAAAQVQWGPSRRWETWRLALRAEYERAAAPVDYDFSLNPSTVIAQLQTLLPRDAVLTLDAGNHTGWLQRFFRFGRPGRQLGPTSGAMGYSVPAAVSAAIAKSRCSLLRWRRWLHDERPRTRDGCAVRSQADHPAVQQRHVRHYPHASGARVPGTDRRHRSAIAGLYRTGPIAWRPCRTLGHDRPVRAGLSTFAIRRQGRADRARLRSAPAHDPVQDERSALTGVRQQDKRTTPGGTTT